jgi:hypothetical protein
MALYLHCILCSRKQAHGLLSSGSWGMTPLPANANVEHPSVRDASVCTCPGCRTTHADWQQRALAALGLAR